MPADITCVRCTRRGAPLEGTTYPGALGEEIRGKVCPRCWEEWQHMEVMVINELRLDFMDPRSQDTIVRHLREFLCLDGVPEGGPPSGAAPTDGPLFEGAPYDGPGSGGEPSGGSEQ